jgi:hypothetical protein
VPVDSHAGDTVGCVLKSQLLGDRKNPPDMPGLPVYDENKTVVGYEVASLGFIPLASADTPTVWAHTLHCLNLLLSGALDGSPELPDCSDAVRAFGYPDPAATAHEIAKVSDRRASESKTLLQQLTQCALVPNRRPNCPGP